MHNNSGTKTKAKMRKLENQAKSKAYRVFFNYYNIALSNNKRAKRCFDLRTNIDKLAYSIYIKLECSVNKNEIRQKQKARAKAKNIQSVNILQNKLLLDFRANKGLIIYKDHLSDGYRNHWAKTSNDFKVLHVLRKNYPNLAK